MGAILKINILSIISLPLLLASVVVKLIQKTIEKVPVLFWVGVALTITSILNSMFKNTGKFFDELGNLLAITIVTGGIFLIPIFLFLFGTRVIKLILDVLAICLDLLFMKIYGGYLRLYDICSRDFGLIVQNEGSGNLRFGCAFCYFVRIIHRIIAGVFSAALVISIVLSVGFVGENGYKSEIYVVPGTYSVERSYWRDIGLGVTRIVPEKKTVTFKRDTRTEIVVSLENPDEMAKIIRESQPSDEILAEEMYSKKIQYMGKVVDLEELWQDIIEHKSIDVYVYSGEMKYVDEVKGMDIILKNPGNKNIPANKAQLVGVRFFDINIILPKGITVGANLKQIVHSETGLLGTPSQCKGTPFVGMELTDNTLIYEDEASGGRIILEVSGDSMLVKSISYEFGRY